MWSTFALSKARYGLTATTVNNIAIFAGGASSVNYRIIAIDIVKGIVNNVVDMYNASSGMWTTATLSQARTRLASTTVGNLAIFGGGAIYQGYSPVVDIYNATDNTWTNTVLSEGRLDPAATTVRDLAIFAGGFNGAVKYL
jgi:hypothetical protein